MEDANDGVVRFVRAIFISLAAALLGSVVGGLFAFPGEGRFWMATLPFTFVGSFLLLLPGYATLRQKGFERAESYWLTIMLGLAGGGLMLVPFSPGIDLLGLGCLFGTLTAASWAGFHWATGGYVRPSSQKNRSAR